MHSIKVHTRAPLLSLACRKWYEGRGWWREVSKWYYYDTPLCMMYTPLDHAPPTVYQTAYQMMRNFVYLTIWHWCYGSLERGTVWRTWPGIMDTASCIVLSFALIALLSPVSKAQGKARVIIILMLQFEVFRRLGLPQKSGRVCLRKLYPLRFDLLF